MLQWEGNEYYIFWVCVCVSSLCHTARTLVLVMIALYVAHFIHTARSVAWNVRTATARLCDQLLRANCQGKSRRLLWLVYHPYIRTDTHFRALEPNARAVWKYLQAHVVASSYPSISSGCFLSTPGKNIPGSVCVCVWGGEGGIFSCQSS